MFRHYPTWQLLQFAFNPYTHIVVVELIAFELYRRRQNVLDVAGYMAGGR